MCIFASAKNTQFRMTTLEEIIRIAVNAYDGRKDMVGNPAVAPYWS